MKALLVFLISFSAFAYEITGTFKAKEVEPILNWEYVSRTCGGTYSCNCDENGCSTCDDSYECGSNEWVRTGSKHLFDLEIEYKIIVKNFGTEVELNPLFLSGDIDTGFSADQIIQKFVSLKAPQEIYISALNSSINTIQIDQKTKRLQLMVDFNMVNNDLINAFFRNTSISSRENLVLNEKLPLEIIDLNMCIGQDRPLNRNTRMLGCLNIIQPRIEINPSVFQESRRNRDYVYFMNWRLKGLYLSGLYPDAPFIVYPQ